MALWKKRKTNQASDVDVSGSEGAAESAARLEWTGSAARTTKLIAVGFFGAALCGVVALGLVLLGVGSQPVPVVQKSAAVSIDDQQAGALAQSYVGAWLQATRSDHASLAQYVSSTSGVSRERAVEYRDLAIASVQPDEKTGLVSVVVSATVQSASSGTDGQQSATVWAPRWWQVTVDAHEASSLSVIGWPTPVAGPEKTQQPVQTSYPSTVSTSSDLGQSVTAFLNAYVAGSGEVGRYTSPGSSISAVSPTPYSTIKVGQVQADQQVEAASEGKRVHVQVNASVGDGESQTVPAQWFLTMTARANRWEVTTVDSLPQISTKKGTEE